MKHKYTGRILAILGLVLLGSSALTWAIGAPYLAIGKVGLALVLFTIYVVTNFGDLGAAATSRGTFFYGTAAVSTLLLLVFLVFANYVVVKNPASWDLTKNKIHSLSDDTIKTLSGLKEDVRVTAFYTLTEQGFSAVSDLCKRYEAHSAHFKCEFVDAIKDPEKTKQFNPKQDSRIFLRLGATEARVGDPSEEALTNAIVKVTHSATKKIYFIAGHGESDPEDTKDTGFSEVKKRMEIEGLKADKLNLATTPEIPADAQALVIAGPKVAFAAVEVETVKRFLDAGGKAFIMLEPMIDSGLDDLLKTYNVEADKSEVVDPVSRLFGTSELAPVVQNYNPDNEITRDFHLNTVFPTARPLTILHEVGATAVVQPVALSMQSAWGETNPSGKVQKDDGEKGGPFPLVVSVTKDTRPASPEAIPAGHRSDQARLVVAGDRDFATNKFRNMVGNEDLFLNCLSWLSEQTERITIRPRLRDASRLYLTAPQQATVFFFAIDVLPVTLLAIGLVVWRVRRNK